jgi:hypothetical protein
MKFRQPCEINRFALESHAVGHLLRDGLPAQKLLPGHRQRPPSLYDFHIIHEANNTPGGLQIQLFRASSPVDLSFRIGLLSANFSSPCRGFYI